MLVQFEVSNLFGSVSEVSFSQLSNILSIPPLPSLLLTFDVSKASSEKVREERLEHPSNIKDISSTFEVLNVSGNSREERLEQPENINLIFLTFAVLKLSEKEREERFEQLENIRLMFSTLEVSNVDRHGIEVRAEQPENI